MPDNLREFIDSHQVFQSSTSADGLDFSEPHELINAVNREMPFGKYKGLKLMQIPEPYFVWLKKRGFPDGKLGQEIALIYEIKLNRLESLVKPLLNSGNNDKNVNSKKSNADNCTSEQMHLERDK